MKRNLYISAAAAAVLAVGGPVAATAAARTLPTAAPAAAAVARADVSADSAASAALKKYPGYVESLDKDGSIWHVNVIGKNGSHAELQVDTSSGAVTQRNQDNNNDSSEYATLFAAKVDAQAAMKAALAAHPGQVWSLNWDNNNDNGKADYWSVEIKSSNGDTANVGIDATTAKVVPADSNNDSNNNNDQDNG